MTLTWSFESMSNTSWPTSWVNEGAQHVTPEIICPILTLFINQSQTTAHYAFNNCYSGSAEVRLIHHLYTHGSFERILHALDNLQNTLTSPMESHLLHPHCFLWSTPMIHSHQLLVSTAAQSHKPVLMVLVSNGSSMQGYDRSSYIYTSHKDFSPVIKSYLNLHGVGAANININGLDYKSSK